jgi:hypothetical protein
VQAILQNIQRNRDGCDVQQRLRQRRDVPPRRSRSSEIGRGDKETDQHDHTSSSSRDVPSVAAPEFAGFYGSGCLLPYDHTQGNSQNVRQLPPFTCQLLLTNMVTDQRK